MKINIAYNTITFEVIETTNSRNWLRRKILNQYNDTLPRFWKFSSREVPEDYFK